MNNIEIWQAVLSELELSISKANFITWFKNTGIVSIQEGQVMLCVPNAFARAWFEKKYHQTIIKSLERIVGKPVRKLEYKIDNIKNLMTQVADNMEAQNAECVSGYEKPSYASASAKAPASSGGFILNQKYVFDTFVVGKGSELAHAAARAVTDRPGEAYNPLFIYGGVGLGKTHLIQAIGNELLKKKPDATILYVSAEKFSNDFIQSVKEKTTKEFQNRYRSIDLLLIDDIQFIAGKEGTQESFFHTFNELHQQNKQVVLTSDRPPKAIPALEDRLKSRFEWGMIADITMPDFETRVAILEKKCNEKNFILPEKDRNKVLQAIAATIQSNIRELEGSLNKIIVYHQLKNITPTVESVKSLLSSIEASSMKQSLTPKQLIETISQFYTLQMDALLNKSREKKVSYPRQIIMYLLREELKMSYPAIGDELGGRDHTTAMHAYEKIRKEVDNNPKLKQEIEMIKQRLYINNV
ncbi:MAG: chromosomal replication initiator protein DnaA [Patescibacteria group bacterium]|nr:chromosomal replication initiator protein DnaA [Patescibacteria group bacterium]